MKVIVIGSSGFIGSNLVHRLRVEGHYVVGVDKVVPERGFPQPDEFRCYDMSLQRHAYAALEGVKEYDRVYQLAANMGGAQFIFTGENDFDILTENAQININVLKALVEYGFGGTIFYSSSACVYPQEIQGGDNTDVRLGEYMAYPANPDSEYGWEKLFSERLYRAAHKNKKIDVRIARFHNIYGPNSDYKTIRAKAPAAMCYKAILASKTGEPMKIIGDGFQKRSFLYIDDCLDGVEALIKSGYESPLNIGSTESVTINQLSDIAVSLADAAGGAYEVVKVHTAGPQGVRSRNSDNWANWSVTGWEHKTALRDGMKKLFDWVYAQEDIDGNR